LYLPFASGIALLTFSIMLIRNFVVALETSETLNVELEARVAEKVNALEQEHARRRQMEQEQLLMQERQRLLQEMHDGLGGHLVHALATAERAPALHSMVDPLKTALEDLRLIIDSLDPEEGTFEAVFSSLRARVASTVDALGMEFTWQLDPALESLELNPHEVLNLARIIQEAVTNVVKHAHASALTVTGSYEPVSRTATFRIQDDGNGFTKNGDGGRGMTSMHGRAAELQGTLSVVSGRHGTRITVTFSH
ncbi:MAG: ATP-binding protein, partial [Pseudomonadota bacterium]